MGYRIWRLMLLVLFASGWLAGCSLVPISAPEVPADEAAVRHEVVMQAMSLLKTDYRWGGAHPEQGLDCSGLVRYVYRQAAAIELPHNAHAIAKQTRSIGREELQPGDLVFFNTLKRPYSHVGIYMGLPPGGEGEGLETAEAEVQPRPVGHGAREAKRPACPCSPAAPAPGPPG
jgi:hypothetical protein